MIEIAGTTNELVQPRGEIAVAREETTELQRTCLAILREQWTTLALVATSAGAPGAAVASALVELSRTYRLRPVRALSGSGAPAAQIALLLDELAAVRGGDTRAVVTVDDPRSNPSGAPLLLAVDAAVLLVRLGSSEFRSVDAALALLGRERVIGCVVAT